MEKEEFKQAIAELLTENPELLKSININITTPNYGRRLGEKLRTALETEIDTSESWKITNGIYVIVRKVLGIPSINKIISEKQYETAIHIINQLLEIMGFKARMEY